MILEVAILNVIPNQEMDFESAFAKASPIVGRISQTLVETAKQFAAEFRSALR